MGSLKDKVTVTKFKKALAQMPKGGGSNAIDLAYEEALSRVNSQLEGHRDFANRILMLIAYAYRPLSVLELREALSVDADSVSFDSEAMPEPEDLTDYCAGLVVVDEQRGVARLVHYTLQEYLDRVRDEKLPGGHRLFTKICMTYLAMHDWREKHPTSKRLVYSGLGDELDEIDEGDEGDEEVEGEEEGHGNSRDKEIKMDIQTFDNGSEHGTGSGCSKPKSDNLTDNQDSMRVDGGDDNDDDNDENDNSSSLTGFSYSSCPGAPSYSGWVTRYLGCEPLLTRHPFITYAMTHWATHMKADSEEDHLANTLAFCKTIGGSKLSLLCVHFVDEAEKDHDREIVDMSDIDLNPLSIAALYGLDQACAAILADLSSYGNYEPLESIPLAVLGNCPGVVEKILRYNRDRRRPKRLVKAVCLHSGIVVYPLHEAADYGKHRVLELLLEYGYDVDEEDDVMTTALDRAAFIEDVESTRLLLRHGAAVLMDEVNLDWLKETFDWEPSTAAREKMVSSTVRWQ